jgi:hypothetical protein
MKKKEIFRSKYDSNKKIRVDNINEYKELLKYCKVNKVTGAGDCDRKMMSFKVKIDNIIYNINEHFYSNNELMFRDICKSYKIKKDGSVKYYKVQVQIEDNVLRNNIINTFPREFSLSSYLNYFELELIKEGLI